MNGKVYLVGAGPGDYKLITLKALECIKIADVIVYDRLINQNYLKEVKENCELINVGKSSNNHLLRQEEINKLLVHKALEGKIVTRLKGGDPYVFGRGGEEGEFLSNNNIEFEVVPGVTSAIGGLCYAGIPITHRDYTSSFYVITGHHRDDGKSIEGINWNLLAKTKGTIVILMGVNNIKDISENLIKEGKDRNTPLAFISSATKYNQKVITTTLENVYEVYKKENIQSPTLIVIGEVVNLRNKLNFFEEKLLFGKNIIVTRSRAQSSNLVEMILDNGGNPIEIPTIKIKPIENNTDLENEIKKIKEYTYIIFSSKNAAEIFFNKIDEIGYDSRILYNIKICAVGEETAKYIKSRGIISDIVPQKYIAEELYNLLKDKLNNKDKILIPRSKNARDFLVKKLSEKCIVKEIDTYETIIDNSRKKDILEIIEDNEICYITFTSSSTVKNFIEIVGKENINKLNNTKIISIGDITSKTIEENGLKVYKQSRESTISSMMETIINDNNI